MLISKQHVVLLPILREVGQYEGPYKHPTSGSEKHIHTIGKLFSKNGMKFKRNLSEAKLDLGWEARIRTFAVNLRERFPDNWGKTWRWSLPCIWSLRSSLCGDEFAIVVGWVTLPSKANTHFPCTDVRPAMGRASNL